jgi:regulatory subunit for Cdc7p protein kinase
MASRRAPLSNLPNAGNSPFRAVAAAAKRSRTQTSHDLDHAYGQPPPLKKKIVELDQQAPDSPRKQHGQTSIDRAPLERVEARRERAVTTRVTRQQKTDENDESLRQWRDHYRRAFPDFVFYFENVPDDSLRRQCIRGLMALGAVGCTTSHAIRHSSLTLYSALRHLLLQGYHPRYHHSIVTFTQRSPFDRP